MVAQDYGSIEFRHEHRWIIAQWSRGLVFARETEGRGFESRV